MLPKSIKNIINAPIPPFLIKQRKGGWDKATKQYKMLDYISGSTAVGLLNYAFGNDYDWIIKREWVQESLDKVYKDEKTGVETITPQPPVAHVCGTLIVHYVDDQGVERTITKESHGSKVITGGASEQESIFKSASTDALKKAASLLGIGLELYREEDENAYFQALEYEDPWKDEGVYMKYQSSWEYINAFEESINEKGESGEDALSQYIFAFSNEISYEWTYITPDNIEDFVAYIKRFNDEESEE